MRGVNLGVFQFDYDLTWAALFMNAGGKTYGRFGGRDAASPDRYLTLPGLKHAMRHALALHRREPKDAGQGNEFLGQTPEDYPAARRLKQNACIHCHQVWDFRRESLKAKGAWTLDEVWVYPPPENIGLEVDPSAGNRVAAVRPESPAARAGLAPGDILQTLNTVAIGSFADIQFALHHAGPAGDIPVAWERGGQKRSATLSLAPGWRRSDISWRPSMWGLDPAAHVYGKDLAPEEKRSLGIPERQLAFRQGQFVPPPARQAGIRAGDIILGIDGQRLEMTMLQFNAHVRLTRKVGERITFNILRDGQRLEIPMVLVARPAS